MQAQVRQEKIFRYRLAARDGILEWSAELLEFAGIARSGAFLHQAGWRRAMPTYQYRCEKCGEVFDRAEHLAEHETGHPSCPKCGSKIVQHMPTPFVAKTARKS